MRLKSSPPLVTLVNAFERPYDNAVAAARTCYAAKGIITPEEVGGAHVEDESERAQLREKRDAIAESIYVAGHHTVFQHAHFQFAIDRVSRHALWAFFHAHPFYNSEQVSQRYVKVKRDSAVVFELGGRAQEVYEKAVDLQQEAYHALTNQLVPVAEKIFYGVFPARARKPEAWKRDIRRKAQEAARYVLPVATWARLYHTISAITLFRYRRLAEQVDMPWEVREIVDSMVGLVCQSDPDFEKMFETPIRLDETAEAQTLSTWGGPVDTARAARFCADFDASLEGRISRLVGFAPEAERVVAESVREVLGALPDMLDDEAALALVADPAGNTVHGEALNLTTLSPLTRTLHHAHYTFRKKLSHTADSQDQRHRMTPGSRPVLLAHLVDEPDVLVPSLVDEDESARAFYDETMVKSWEAIGELRSLGVPDHVCAYLLPNAVAVRFTESGDFSALRHKHAMRLCYNAQEEIWRASLDEALQVHEVHPRLGQHLLPPCTIRLRGGKKPYCPEGPRYCGVPVWKQSPAEYVRKM